MLYCNSWAGLPLMETLLKLYIGTLSTMIKTNSVVSWLPYPQYCMTKLCTQDAHSSCLRYLCYAPPLPAPVCIRAALRLRPSPPQRTILIITKILQKPKVNTLKQDLEIKQTDSNKKCSSQGLTDNTKILTFILF